MSESWFCEQISNLSIKENRLTALSEIRGRLNEINGSTDSELEVVVTSRLLAAPEIYKCLENDNEHDQQCELATDILSICMSNLSISQTNLPILLERALIHPRSNIQAMAFNSILKQLQKEANEISHSHISGELVNHILNGLRHENTEVGVPVIAILSILLESRLDQEGIKKKLLDMFSCSDIVKCRLYEVAVSLAKQSPSLLQKVEFLLDRGLSELDNDDVLFQINVLEILVSLAQQNHGLLYLEKRQVFEIISKRVENSRQRPLDLLFVPGIMNFFGKAAAVQPQKIIVGYPHMIECLFECIISGDFSMLPSSLDTFANLTQSAKGKLILDENYSEQLKESLQQIAFYLRNLPTDLKNRAFNTLEIVFTTADVPSSDLQVILRKWFIYLAAGENMQFLMEFCRNPFPDIKVACLSFIKSVCLYRWGIVLLKNTAGFVEYLLDRKIEFDKEAKYKKFELISILADSDLFDVQTNLQLRTYTNEGPYFVQSIMDIATEGN